MTPKEKKLKAAVIPELQQAYKDGRKEVLKELIMEYQNNQLDGVGYNFYFSISRKIDLLNSCSHE